MYKAVFLLFFVIGCSFKNATETSSAIPDLLSECYANDTNISNRIPLTMQLVIAIIRKLELKSETAFNARILATSMLHSVIFDGVRRSQTVGDEVMIPYRATGEEFYNYKLLVEYLTSGESLLFPRETLTTPELCLLHMMVSNTVDPWKRGDESTTCIHQSNLPFEIGAMEEQNQVSTCPIKKGCVSTKWGSVIVRNVIAAIASAFQEQTVTFEKIENSITNATKHKSITKRSTQNVNNVWVATIAGDLATVVLKQLSNTPEIGTQGFWNDSTLPQIYYLKSANWDMTECDILGDLDGLTIARYLEHNDVSKIRLSQLIDMFYSARGMINTDEYKVTNRSLTLGKLLNETNVEEQVEYTAKLLQQIGTYDNLLNSEQINQLSPKAVEKFKVVAGNITRTYDTVESIHVLPFKSPIEMVIILDGSYDAYSALQVIYGLTEATQVSYYGSKLGVINGQSGKWMANVTNDLFQLFYDLNQSYNKWPSTLSLGTSLESVIYYYQNKTSADCLVQITKPMARSIIILSGEGGKLTDNDFKSSLRAFNSIKRSNPETSFIITSNSFTELSRNFWDNDHALTPSGSINSIIQDISKSLSTIPANIINFYCNQNEIRLVDYITPNVTSSYQIRKEYVQATPITTKFLSGNTGSLFVCAHADSSKNEEVCKNITVNDEIRFDSQELCESACNIEYSISVDGTEVACNENACRYPDQVRLEIIWHRSSGCVPHNLYILSIIIISNLVFIL